MKPVLLERLLQSGDIVAEGAMPPAVLAAAGVRPGRDVLEVALPSDPASPAEARRELACYCRDHHVPPDQAGCAALVVSELVTNAVVHARTPALLWAEYDAGQLTVAVGDGDTSRPAPRPPDPSEERRDHLEGGRGMAIVAELGIWGVIRTRLGKVVWARLRGPRGERQRQS